MTDATRSIATAIACPWTFSRKLSPTEMPNLIHFIRDLNEALLKHPYDVGLKRLAGDFAGLLKPMVETVDRHGLKKRFLGKHRSSVHRFYSCLADRIVTSEAAEKLVSRLQKN